MLKRLVAFVAVLSIASSAFAATITTNSAPNVIKNVPGQSQTLNPQVTEAGDLTDLDLTGITSWDGEGDPSNTVINVALPAGATVVNGIGWDLTQTAGIDSGGASWLSEMTIGIDTDLDGVNDLFVTPSGTSSPGTESNSSGGVIKLVDAGIPDLPTAGSVNVEFFESFIDEDDAPEGVYDQGTLTIQTEIVPEPAAMSLLMIAGLGGLALRRRS